jgi:hypothetical protein
MNADIHTIKNILVFFCVLAVIGLMLSIASGAYVVYQQYSGTDEA